MLSRELLKTGLFECNGLVLHIELVCIFVEETTLCVDVCVCVVFIGNLQITEFLSLLKKLKIYFWLQRGYLLTIIYTLYILLEDG